MKFGLFVAGIVLGGGITYLGLNSIGQSEPSNSTTENKNIEKKPLYWVAPMDANYRRDKPGKSPMGMDLIPFYGNQGSGPDEGEGTIKISPSVVNNLGVRTDLVKKQSLHSQINTVDI